MAVLNLLCEVPAEDLRMPLVAERSGVHVSTLYRRWGSINGLIADVVTERLSSGSPPPNTGSLRGDLEAYARGVVRDLSHPLGAALVRAAALVRDSSDVGGRSDEPTYDKRLSELDTMLDRARSRGESAPTVMELVDVLLQPFWGHVLFQHSAPSIEHALSLVDRLMRLAERNPTRPSVEDDAPGRSNAALKEFAILVYSSLDRWEEIPADSMDEDMTAHAQLISDLAESGALVFCSPLAPPTEGLVVEVRNQAVATRPEGAQEAPILAGFYIVRCSDADVATQIAARIPDAITHRVIVRPLLQLPGIGSVRPGIT